LNQNGSPSSSNPDSAVLTSSLISFFSGIPPNKEGMLYTIPVVRFADGKYLMDSFAIAKEIESTYPSPSLHLDYEKLQEVIENVGTITSVTRATWMSKIPRDLLPERSAEYFQRTRHERFGMSLDQLERDHGSDERWEEAKAPAKVLGDILRASGGPFYMGSTGE